MTIAMKDLENLDRRFDGTVPQRLRDIVIYGSALEADIVEFENLMAFYQEDIKRTNLCGGRWFRKGRYDMVDRCNDDVQAAARELRRLGALLTQMKERLAAK